ATVSWRALSRAPHPCGPLGLAVTHTGVGLFGRFGATLLPLAIGLAAWATMWDWEKRRALAAAARLVALALFVAVLGSGAGDEAGGAVGRLGLDLLRAVLGHVGSTILLAAILAGGLLRWGSPIARPVLAQGGAMLERAHGAGSLGRDLWQRLKDDIDGLWNGPRDDHDDDSPLFARDRIAPARAAAATSPPAAAPVDGGGPRIRQGNPLPQPP